MTCWASSVGAHGRDQLRQAILVGPIELAQQVIGDRAGVAVRIAADSHGLPSNTNRGNCKCEFVDRFNYGREVLSGCTSSVKRGTRVLAQLYMAFQHTWQLA